MEGKPILARLMGHSQATQNVCAVTKGGTFLNKMCMSQNGNIADYHPLIVWCAVHL